MKLDFLNSPLKQITKLPQKYAELNVNQRREIRELYVIKQKGLCKHCEQPLEGDPSWQIRHTAINLKLFPEGFFNYPIHLHHSHKTGMTLGTVHNRCNAYLWQYRGE